MSRSILATLIALAPAIASAAPAVPEKDAAASAAIQLAQVSPGTGDADGTPATEKAAPATVTEMPGARAKAQAPANAEAPAAEQPKEDAPAKVAPAPASAAPAGPSREATGLDARTRRLSDALVRSLKALKGDHRDQVFAIVPFAEQDADAKDRSLGVVVADLVLTNMVRDHRLSFVERSRLADVLDEQALGFTGVLDVEPASKMGKVLDVDAIIVGQITDTGDNYEVSARTIDVSTAAVLSSETMTLPKEELIAVSADAVVLKSRAGAGFRSLVAPGWGQVYNGEPVKAALIGGTAFILALSTVAAVGTGGVFHFLYVNWAPPTDSTITKEEQAAATSGLRAAANGGYIAGMVLLGVTAVAWLGGAIEAYISGTDVDTLDQALLKE